MKIVNLIIVFGLLLVGSGCSDARGLNNVQKKFKTSDVRMIPNRPCSFIARLEDGSIWYAFSSGITDNTIDEVQLFGPINKDK